MSADRIAEFERFYEATRARLLLAVYRLVQDWHKAEDVTQEVYLTYYWRSGEGEVIRDPKAWIHSQAHFLSLSHLAKSRKRSVPTEHAYLATLAESSPTAFSRPPSTPDRAAEEQEGLDGLAFWASRLLCATVGDASPLLRARVAALVAAEDRGEALQELQRRGDRWSKTSVSMTLARHSDKLDDYLRRTWSEGPSTEQERTHWPVLVDLWSFAPGSEPRGVHSSLARLIRLLNGLDRRRRLLLADAVLTSSLLPSFDQTSAQA